MLPTLLILALLVLPGEFGITFAYNVGTSWQSGSAFAALNTSGSVVTWGDSNSGGDYCVRSAYPDYTCITDVSSSLSSGVSVIYSTSGAFAALKTDGSVSLSRSLIILFVDFPYDRIAMPASFT